MVYWGGEDLDWPERLSALGYSISWMPEPHRVYHRWHLQAEANGFRPVTATLDSVTYMMENRLRPRLAQDWGRPLSWSDRPILALVEGGTRPKVAEVPTNGLMKYELADLVLGTRGRSSFARLDLGPRIVQRPLSALREPAKRLLRPLSALTSNSVVDKLNGNFDAIYHIIPILLENGLVDYYFSENLEQVFLLWGS